MKRRKPRGSEDPTEIVTGAPSVVREAHTGESQPNLGPITGQGQQSFGERYVYRSQIGSGGMGEVMLFVDQRIGREVAVKVNRTRLTTVSTEQSRRRFIREARVQGQLEHPAIVPVYDMGRHANGEAYFTMRHLRGMSLQQVLVGLSDSEPEIEKQYSLRRLLGIFERICLAIHYSHSRGVVHRDIKPMNLMLGDFGEVYVLDWGVAKLSDDTEELAPQVRDAVDADATREGETLGTPGYMAPEQVRGEHLATDTRADVYALGAVLFEMLCLSKMHTGDREESIHRTLTVDGCRPSERAPEREIPPELDDLCYRATRLSPEDRISSAAELAESVQAYLDGDRNLELRLGMAEEHSATATLALEEMKAQDSDETILRQRVMRHVSLALGLDPKNTTARRTFLEILTRPPRETPAEVRESLRRSENEALQLGARMALLAYVSFALFVPFLLLMGIRQTGAFWLMVACDLACVGVTLFWVKSGGDRSFLPVHLTVTTLTVAATSLFFGPLVLVPTIAMGNTVAYITGLPYRRGIITAAGCAAIVVPALLQWMGAMPNTYAWTGDAIHILPTMVQFAPIPSMAFLLIASLMFVALISLFVSRLRGKYDDAIHSLRLQTWQLAQILPDGEDAASKP